MAIGIYAISANKAIDILPPLETFVQIYQIHTPGHMGTQELGFVRKYTFLRFRLEWY